MPSNDQESGDGSAVKNCVLDLEGVAREVYLDMGERCPVSAFAIAEYCGVEVRGWLRNTGKRSGDSVWFPIAARSTRQHGVLAHELAHWLMEDANLEHGCEASAKYLAGALMLPMAPFARDVEIEARDLYALQRKHPNASAEMIAVRIVQTSGSAAWVWDNGRLAKEYGEGGCREAAAEVADQALSSGAPAKGDACEAWPFFDGDFRRVIVLRAS